LAQLPELERLRRALVWPASYALTSGTDGFFIAMLMRG